MFWRTLVPVVSRFQLYYSLRHFEGGGEGGPRLEQLKTILRNIFFLYKTFWLVGCNSSSNMNQFNCFSLFARSVSQILRTKECRCRRKYNKAERKKTQIQSCNFTNTIYNYTNTLRSTWKIQCEQFWRQKSEGWVAVGHKGTRSLSPPWVISYPWSIALLCIALSPLCLAPIATQQCSELHCTENSFLHCVLLSMQSSEVREDDLWHGKEVSVKYMGQLSTTLVLLLLTPQSHHSWAENWETFCRPILPKHQSSSCFCDIFVRWLFCRICDVTFCQIWTPLALTHLLSHILPRIVVSSGSSVFLFIDHMILWDCLAF